MAKVLQNFLFQLAVPAIEQVSFRRVLKRCLHFDQCVCFVKHLLEVLDHYFKSAVAVVQVDSVDVIADPPGLSRNVIAAAERNGDLWPTMPRYGQCVVLPSCCETSLFECGNRFVQADPRRREEDQRSVTDRLPESIGRRRTIPRLRRWSAVL